MESIEEQIEVEIWAKSSFDNLVEVSSLGRVRDVSPFKRIGLPPETFINDCRRYRQGYVFYYVSNNERYNIHREVGLAFIPNPENKPFINHKNGIKWDNRASNLEWCTTQENNRHSYHVLDNNSQHKKRKVKIIKDGIVITTAISVREAARIVGGYSPCISAVCNGKARRQHKGYTFEYA